MLTLTVNTVQINNPLTDSQCFVDAPVHPSLQRLFDFAEQATARSAAPVKNYRDLLIRLQVSPAVMTNWKKRGVSKEGALRAEQELGCSAQWVISGEGSPLTFRPRWSVAEPEGRYKRPSVEDTLDQFAILLQQLPPGTLDAFVDVLNAWARKAGRDPQRRGVMLALAGAETKPLSAAG